MNPYKRLLQNLDVKNSLAISSSKSIAFILTGQSSYNHSELTSEQKGLLTIFEEFGIETIKTNFPYNNKHVYKNAQHPNLLNASILNTSQFLQSVFDSQYGHLVSQHLSPCFKNRNNVFVVTGSLGQQMLIKSLNYFEELVLKSVTIFALGPVTTSTIAGDYPIKMVTIKGKLDYLSRFVDKTPTDHLVNCGHMDYYQNKAVRSIINHYLEKITHTFG